MIERCYYPKHKDYHNYGGRGITVCDEWKDHPREFINWIENESNWTGRKGLTLDRIDTNKNYNPSNCTFSHHSVQALNKNIASNNKSGYPGITKHNDRWRVRININGKRESLGVYKTKKEAIEARKNAEMKYYGKLLYD